jgi:hypothetical protein
MSNWKLKSNCSTKHFLEKCIIWPRYNDENDMPLKGSERLKVPANFKKLWG